MTRETLNKANQIVENIRDLETIIYEFNEGAAIRIEGTGYGHPVTKAFIQKEISNSIISGLILTIEKLEKELKSL